MHGLPEGFEGDSFVGRELEVITFGVNVIHLAFGPEHSVTVENWVRYQTEPGGEIQVDSLPPSQSNLPILLGRMVERVDVLPPGGLEVHFHGGASLFVDDDSKQYESYTVKTPTGEFFV